jgi:flavin reductase (DIM6/NTAB) family NADH-FMN oxidoreductase RutF
MATSNHPWLRTGSWTGTGYLKERARRVRVRVVRTSSPPLIGEVAAAVEAAVVVVVELGAAAVVVMEVV